MENQEQRPDLSRDIARFNQMIAEIPEFESPEFRATAGGVMATESMNRILGRRAYQYYSILVEHWN